MRERHSQRGSALLLVPAGVLVLVVLGAVAVDSAVVLLAQRQLADVAAGAANDGAAAALDDAGFYRAGTLRVAQDRAQAAAEASFRRTAPAGLLAPAVRAEVLGADPPRVRVTASAEVELVFARAVPGASERVAVRASSTAAGVETSS